MYRKVLASMMTFAMLSTMLASAAELQKLTPTGTALEIQKPYHDALKNENGELENYYKVVYSGYFDLPMVLNSKSNVKADPEMVCDLRMYIPENSRYSQPTIYLMVPSETDPCEFMEQSGWKETADKNSLTVFLLMPKTEKDANGEVTKWGKWSDYTEQQVMTYINGAVDVSGQRPGIQTVSYCFYAVGYGDAADYMTKYVVQNPTKFAGAFSVGATGAGAELIETMQGKPSREIGVMMSDLAVPFGMVAAEENENVSALVEYFKDANKTLDAASEKYGFTYYAPDPAAEVGAPDTDPCAAVCFKNAEMGDCLNAEFTQSVFDFFNTVRRYPGYINTELRAYEDVYTSPRYHYYTSKSALGRYTYGGDIHAEGDGEYYNREWWVYVSDKAKERMDADEKVETVFLFMGSNGYGDEIAQRTGWNLIADKEGCILVCPSGHVRHQGNFGNFDRNGVDVYQYCTNWSWNPNGATEILPDDRLMIDDIYGWLFENPDCEFYGKLDQSKVYASGQSAGGAFTHFVAQQRPQYFAAAMPCSWVDDGDDADTSSDVAMLVFMGQLDTTIRGALSTTTGMDGLPGGAQAMFDNYIARYGNLTDEAGRGAWSDFTFCQEANGNGDSVCTKREGSFNEYILQTPKGVPMFVGVEVIGLTHATIPTECETAWNIMKNFTKDPATHALSYQGEVVDTPVSTALAAK